MIFSNAFCCTSVSNLHINTDANQLAKREMKGKKLIRNNDRRNNTSFLLRAFIDFRGESPG